MSNPNPVIRLLASIDNANRLVVELTEEGGRTIALSAESGLEDVLVGHRDAHSITLEVHDFYQYQTVYEVYALTLADDNRRILHYWQDTEKGTGKWRTFTTNELQETMPVFVIGATPRSQQVPEPRPFAPGLKSNSGPFPISAKDTKGQD